MKIPNKIFSGYHGRCHCQGIAIDKKRGYIYYSFTTKLIKADLTGNVIGSVDGLIGHLGCISYCEADGRVYGSLEFKNDCIGKGILAELGVTDAPAENAFYCAIFDVEKIDRMEMDAERDGVMRAVYLPEVVEDFEAEITVGNDKLPHRYACSGIDGISFGPHFGCRDGYVLNICYGVYGDTSRKDNDYQVILSYDPHDWWDTVAKPLDVYAMSHSGAKSNERYFIYTGSTNWGIQNLEYDSYSGNWIAAVYPGSKPEFENFSIFIIDGKVAPNEEMHPVYGEKINVLKLSSSSHFPLGATGVFSFGDGYFYFSEPGYDKELGQYANIILYRATDDKLSDFTVANETYEY